MHEAIVLDSIIQLVPQWYHAGISDEMYRYVIKLSQSELVMSTHMPLSARLMQMLEYARARADVWEHEMPEMPTPGSISRIREDLIIKWLESHDPSVNWNKWIAYAQDLRMRTYENGNIQLTLVVSDGEGTVEITDRRLQKIIDPLGAHQQVFFRVDRELRFLDYDEISWSDVHESRTYKFTPEFLQPVVSILKRGEYCLHLTHMGDVLVVGVDGILASCRKGHWHIYENEVLLEFIVDMISDKNVGRNLIEVMFDLSYRRKGALLIFDPERTVLQHVINRGSIIGGEDAHPDFPRAVLQPRINAIHMGRRSVSARKKRLLLEIAEIDGAVIFDLNEILAFGAMIENHPAVGSYYGARATAARSALMWGGHSFSVSSDGEVTALFSAGEGKCKAELSFM